MSSRYLFVSMILVTIPAFAGPMTPGMWEIETTMQITGMPVTSQPMKIKRCFTKKDISGKPDGFAKASTPGQGCQVSDVKQNGATYKWAVQCNNKQGKMNGTGEMTQKSNRFDGIFNFTMQMPGAGKTMTMKQTVKGRRLGGC